MFCVKSFVAAVFSLCILRGQTLPPVHTMSAPIDLHASSEICCLFSSLPPQFSENMRYIEQKKSLASSVGIYNILTSRLKNCVCLSLPNFSLTKAHFLFLCLSLSFSLVTVFGAARFSVVSPDEYSFVSCVSLYTPSYQRPKVVSPPHPLTHHTVCLSFLPTWQLIFLFLLLSKSTLWTSLPPERQFVLLWNTSKDGKHCRSSSWSRQKESTDCRLRNMLEEKVPQHDLLSLMWKWWEEEHGAKSTNR